MSVARITLHRMVKFDPEGFDVMMARIAAEQQEARSPYEDLEPDYEYMGVTAHAAVSDA